VNLLLTCRCCCARQGIYDVSFSGDNTRILSMKSIDGEEVHFARPILITDVIESWLATLAEEMKARRPFRCHTVVCGLSCRPPLSYCATLKLAACLVLTNAVCHCGSLPAEHAVAAAGAVSGRAGPGPRQVPVADHLPCAADPVHSAVRQPH
jgi:hypothetical protein